MSYADEIRLGTSTMATSVIEQIQEIREMVKSNPELVRRLNLVELRVNETHDQTEAWCSSIEEKLREQTDDSFGDIHALQVQNSILKAKLQQIELDKLETDNDQLA